MPTDGETTTGGRQPAPVAGPRLAEAAAAGRGLVIVYTGDGKGKTSAALGTALRALGAGLSVCFIQYLKRRRLAGEAKVAAALPGLDFLTLGAGFTWTRTPADHMAALARAWATTQDVVLHGHYGLVVLDEINYALAARDLPVADVFTPATVVDLLRRRPPHLHVVLTGRGADPLLVDYADLVTEMREVKHHYRPGSKPVRGVDF